jgi:hypothetical protein
MVTTVRVFKRKGRRLRVIDEENLHRPLDDARDTVPVLRVLLSKRAQQTRPGLM